jgi:hypothetical protein
MCDKFQNTFRRHPILPENFLDFSGSFLEQNSIFGCSKISFHGLQIFSLDSSSLNLSIEVFLDFFGILEIFFRDLK